MAEKRSLFINRKYFKHLTLQLYSKMKLDFVALSAIMYLVHYQLTDINKLFFIRIL